MLENLRIAAQRQKKIILIFFLTILIPSIFLGVFGIRAVRNERFRLAKQLENEHRQTAGYLISQVKNYFRELGSGLQNLALSSPLKDRDYPEIKSAVVDQLTDNPLIDFIFIAYEDSKPFFPQFQPVSERKMSTLLEFTSSQLARLRKAEGYEFEQKRYDSAISLYRELFDQTEDENLKAQMLSNMARSQAKNGDYEKAIENYRAVFEDYKFTVSAAKLPLAIIAGLQTVDCYRELGDSGNAMKTALILYKNICDMTWDITEAQFKIYCSLVFDAVAGKELSQEWQQLNILYEERIEQWQAMKDIEQEIVPELKRRLKGPTDFETSALFYAATINETPYLIVSVGLPSRTDTDSSGLLGAKTDNGYLADHVVLPLIESMQFSESTSVVISDLGGSFLMGEKKSSTELATITEYFGDNFPPWKIEFFRSRTSGFAGMNLRKSFYFWTIVVLLVVLIFGAALIMRTVSHEMGVLKMKSDFVSSVSHEFKTPLTSIRTLTGRMQEGKVRDKAKMDQYISIIAQDTDKLTRLVGNILDFSKMEEGKREFDFVETDVVQLVSYQVQEFQKDELRKDFSVKLHMPEDIPNLAVDREAFSQALINLLDNAVKFSRDDKEIQVILRKDMENVILEVKDKGIGIPLDDWDKIFHKFYQGKNALRQTVKGAGLGLTLVKHTVEAHGGRVSVKSRVGEGSTFSLIFPIEKKSK